MLKMQSLSDYLTDLASSHPTPGGGTAAALTGAQGVALLSMVCNLTLGKKRFAGVEAEILSILEFLERQRPYLIELAQRDMEVFQAVMTAHRLPKTTPSDTAARAHALQSALKASAQIPFDLFTTCMQLLPFADRLENIGNPSVLSDVVVGRHLLFAGILSAQANVEANLVLITDEQFCLEKREHMQQALAGLGQVHRPYSF